MKTAIRNSQQIPIAYVDSSSNLVRIYDKYGSKMLGNYNKITNSTYTSTGRLLGKGNLIQLLIK